MLNAFLSTSSTYYYLDSSFPRTVRPIEEVLIHLSLKEVTVCAGHSVLMVVDLYFIYCW